MHPVIPYVVAAGMFGLGCYGVLVRRNAVLLLMAVELMLNAVNLIFVTADTTVRAVLPHSGQVFALFVIVLAAAEIGVGLAVVLQLYRLRHHVLVDAVRLDGGPDGAGMDDTGGGPDDTGGGPKDTGSDVDARPAAPGPAGAAR
ncbi:NADH-quinone oxidoreductase subunit NuoK [Planosporangium sp. 12N6]|uniref:NADH-quinone oxidoreductase subunit NuoK n=1 Tax=Planosporangium spinosum TaxID=3402278 RepID=UPI003CF2BEE0